MVACPTCGKELTFIKEYDRYYCYAEAKYAPKGYGTPPAAAPSSGPAIAPESHDGHYHCPSCGKELTFIEQYGRYYCYAEQKYAPKDVKPIGAPALVAAEPVAAAPVTEPVTVEPAPEPVSFFAAELGKEEKPETPPTQEPVPVETPAETPPTAEAPAETPPATEEPARPALVRSAVTKAKKAQLMAWCDAYGLDPIGTRTVLRDRLLQYMDDHRIDMEEEIAAAEPAPTPVEPAPAPEVAPSVAPEAVEPAKEEPTPEPAIPPTPEPVPEPSLPVVEPAPAEPTPPEAAPAEAPKLEAPSVEPPKAVEPALAAIPPPAAEVKVEKPLPCPTCGKELTYVAKYDRLYCYSCGNYAPKGFGKEPAPEPPLTVVEVPKPAVEEAPKAAEPVVITAPVVAPPKVEAPKAAHPCPTCGAELRFIKDYDRWFCDAEHKYAPKDWGRPARNACPTCGKDLTWIPEYKRWYCYAESKYAPRTIASPEGVVAAAVPAVRVEPAAPAISEARVVAVEQAKHAHGRPGAGIAIAAVGFAILIMVNLLRPGGLLHAAGVFDPVTAFGTIPALFFPLLEFLGYLMALVGVAVGLFVARSR